MRRLLVPFMVWLAATVVAVSLAFVAIGTVVDEAGVREPLSSPPVPGAAETPGEADVRSGEEILTYGPIGGEVAIRRDGDRLALLWARPKDGFDVKVARGDGETVLVRFRSDTHRSRLEISSEDGELREQVEERPD